MDHIWTLELENRGASKHVPKTMHIKEAAKRRLMWAGHIKISLL